MPSEHKHKPFRVYLKGEDKTDSVRDVRCIGEKCEVIFNDGKTFLYKASNVRRVESALSAKKSRDCFEYLERVAAEIGLKIRSESGEEKNILSRNYSTIDFVAPDGMLGIFLSGEMPKSAQISQKNVTEPVYPFGFNASQKDAVDKALANQLSIIEGPPGTGKTQTILNIIANAVMRGESVAVVSNNNSATMNVLDKLQKYGVDFIAAYLGNSDNKKDFINSQKALLDKSEWRLESEISSALRQTLNLLCGLLREKLAQKNELAVLKQELSAIETERKHFLQYSERLIALQKLAEASMVETSMAETPGHALEMCLLCEIYGAASRGKGVIAFIKSILDQFRFMSKRARYVRKLLKQNPCDYLVAVFQLRFYELRIAELTHHIFKLTRELESFDFDVRMSEYSEILSNFWDNRDIEL